LYASNSKNILLATSQQIRTKKIK